MADNISNDKDMAEVGAAPPGDAPTTCGARKSSGGKRPSSGKFVMRAAQPSHINASLMCLPKLGLRGGEDERPFAHVVEEQGAQEVQESEYQVQKNDYIKEGLALKERWKHAEDFGEDEDDADAGCSDANLPLEGEPCDMHHSFVSSDLDPETLEFDDGDRDIEVTPILKNIDRRRDSEKSVSFSINGDEVIPRLADFDEEEELEKRSDCAETPTESKELEEYSGDTDTAAANGNAHDAEELTVDTSDGIATNGNFEESPLEEDSQSGEDLEEPACEANISELDYASGQVSGQLNMDASKQKVSLRQKGSLAKRRKPSRGSMRMQSSDVDHFIVSADGTGEGDVTNGNESEEERDDPSKDEVEDMEKEQLAQGTSPNDSSPPLGTSPTEQTSPLSTSPKVLLPGLGANVKLKNTSPTSETPPVVTREAETTVDVTNSPEVEASADAPNWVKEALAKKRRASEKLLIEETLNKTEDPSSPPPAPWMKERSLRKVNPMLPHATHHYNAKSLDKNANETSSGDKDKKHSINESVKMAEKEIAVEKEVTVSSNASSSSHGASVIVNTKSESNVSPETSKSVNRSPGEVLIIDSRDIPKNAFSPPARSPVPARTVTSPASTASSDSTDSPTAVPSWKAEIQQRKKTKSFIPTQRPNQPMRLGETPQWKKDLAERNKHRQKSTDQEPGDPGPASEGVTSPSWQDGVKLKKTPQASKENSGEAVADWAAEVEKRRERLASTGLLDNEGKG